MSRKVSLKAGDLSAGETASFRTCSFTDTGGSTQTVKILATADMTIGTGEETEPGLPPGYEERVVQLFCGSEMLQCTILVKSNTDEAPTNIISTPYVETDERHLLQVKGVTGESGTMYQLELDFGYLAE